MLWSTQTYGVLFVVMSRTSPSIAKPEQHSIGCVSLRTVDGLPLCASGCAMRRADGVPAFLS